jgi:hypothetical protein
MTNNKGNYAVSYGDKSLRFDRYEDALRSAAIICYYLRYMIVNVIDITTGEVLKTYEAA